MLTAVAAVLPPGWFVIFTRPGVVASAHDYPLGEELFMVEFGSPDYQYTNRPRWVSIHWMQQKEADAGKGTWHTLEATSNEKPRILCNTNSCGVVLWKVQF